MRGFFVNVMAAAQPDRRSGILPRLRDVVGCFRGWKPLLQALKRQPKSKRIRQIEANAIKKLRTSMDA